MSGSGAARGRLLTAACGAALVALSFVPLWATYRVSGLGLFAPETRRMNAWDAYGLGMELALILAAVTVVIAVVGRAAPAQPAALFVLGLVTALALLWEAVAGPEGSSGANEYGASRGVLLFAGMGLACGMTYGGYLAVRGARPQRRSERADRGE
ncbi:MAG TPA: hypothetical protein VG318_18550 [Actinomycetota bacterium]|nr:hypothetical protein [Actinomycetota bacterium]